MQRLSAFARLPAAQDSDLAYGAPAESLRVQLAHEPAQLRRTEVRGKRKGATRVGRRLAGRLRTACGSFLGIRRRVCGRVTFVIGIVITRIVGSIGVACSSRVTRFRGVLTQRLKVWQWPAPDGGHGHLERHGGLTAGRELLIGGVAGLGVEVGVQPGATIEACLDKGAAQLSQGASEMLQQECALDGTLKNGLPVRCERGERLVGIELVVEIEELGRVVVIEIDDPPHGEHRGGMKAPLGSGCVGDERRQRGSRDGGEDLFAPRGRYRPLRGRRPGSQRALPQQRHGREASRPRGLRRPRRLRQRAHHGDVLTQIADTRGARAKHQGPHCERADGDGSGSHGRHSAGSDAHTQADATTHSRA